MVLVQCRLEGRGTANAACLFLTGRPRMRSHQVIVIVSDIALSAPDSPSHDCNSSKEYSTSNSDDNPDDYAFRG